jgi:hypothetical protein
MFSGRGPFSRILRWGSDSHYSHCGIASWEAGRLMVFHAVVRGVHHEPASTAVRNYTGRVDWHALTGHEAPSVDRAGVITEARKHLHKPFAWGGMFHLMWQVFRGGYRQGRDTRRVKAMFCSWYVSHCYRVGGGLDLVPMSPDRCTSPAMIERSEHLVLRGRLHHGTVPP